MQKIQINTLNTEKKLQKYTKIFKKKNPKIYEKYFSKYL